MSTLAPARRFRPAPPGPAALRQVGRGGDMAGPAPPEPARTAMKKPPGPTIRAAEAVKGTDPLPPH